ncbi:MAG: general secretion pathway protein GspB [Proteobacteria bacterium]|nr:general secretion pathway protein GspB [Pseudomonadota bacterium]
MSFILDALKKSESERQRQSVPGLLDVPMPAPKQRFPIWGVLLGLLLGVNLVVLLVVLVRSDSSRPAATPAVAAPLAPTAMQPGGASAPVTAAYPAPAGATPNYAPGAVAGPPTASMTGNAAAGAVPTIGTASANAAPFSPMDSPVYAPEVPVEQGSANRQGAGYAAAQVPAQVQVAQAPAQTPPIRNTRATLPPEAQLAPDPNEIVPTLQELNLTGNHGIPELHLDIHVYANRPADRFVFINNRKYKEGSTLQEGPTVEHITRDGVLLRYQNLRFSIPRQ